MDKLVLLTRNRNYIFILSLIFLLTILLTSCKTSEMQLSEFDFIYQNEKYTIRSAYCPGNPESCNQIIGKNFIAVDQDQDRIIDKIIDGNTSLNKAQEIYDYCLGLLERQNKLNTVQSQAKTFSIEDEDYSLMIKSIIPKIDKPVNEFSITNSNTNLISIYLDKEADGVLDDLLSGTMDITEAQKYYERLIAIGLKSNEIINKDSSVIVNQSN